MRAAILAGLALTSMTAITPAPQLPGDRPAANPRSTQVRRDGAQRRDRDEPAARVGGRPARAAAGRQRYRRRRHRRRRPLRRRADDERARRGPLRDRVRREDEAGARAERERARRTRRDAGGIPPTEARRDSVPRRALRQRSRRGRRVERAPREARHDRPCARARAGHRLRPRRLRRERDHLAPVAERREDPRAGPRGRSRVPAWRARALGWRCLPKPEARRDAGRDRARRPRRVLSRADRARDRCGHEAAGRSPRRGRPRRAPVELDRSDLDELSRLRRVRAPAEHPGHRRARDAEHSRRRGPEGARPQFRRVSPHARRSQAHRVRRSRRVARRISMRFPPVC